MKQIMNMMVCVMLFVGSLSLHAVNIIEHFAAQTLVEPTVAYGLNTLGVKNGVDISWSPGDKRFEKMTQAVHEVQAMLKSGKSGEVAQAFAKVTPHVLVSAVQLYGAYKAPQWIDNFILGSNEKRTTTQNIVSLLGRHGYASWNPLKVGIHVGYRPYSKDLILRNLITEIIVLGIEENTAALY